MISLGTAVLGMSADTSGLARGLNEAERQTHSFASSFTSSFQRIGEIASGVLLGNLIPRAIEGIAGLGREALGAVGSYEKMSMAFESLLAREIKNASAITETIQIGQTRAQLTEQEIAKLADLGRQRDLLNARLQEEIERHRQLVAKWGEEGLAVKTHSARLAELQADLGQVAGAYDKLAGKQGQIVAVTQTETRYTKDLTQARGEAAVKAAELLKWSELLAIRSPFDQEGVTKAFKTAMAYGFVSESLDTNVVSAKRLTQAMIDYASGSGQSTDAMNRIALALGQIQARGKLAGQEVMQLTEIGISVDAILAKAFGKSTAEIIAMREKGLIPADQAIMAIVKSLEEDFSGAAARSTNTVDGLLNSLGDIKKIGLRELFTGVFDALKPLATGLVDLLTSEEFIGRVRAFGQSIGETVRGIVGFAQGATDTIGRMVDAFNSYSDAGLGTSAAINAALSQLGLVVPRLQPVIDMIQDIVARAGELTQAFQEDGLPAVGDKLSQWGQELLAYITTNAPLWGATLKTEIGQVWANLTENVFPAVSERLTAWWNEAVIYVQTNAPLWAEQLRTQIGQVWQALTTFDTGAATGLTGFGQLVQNIQLFVADVQLALQPLIDFFAPTFERVKEAVGTLGAQFEALKPKFGPLVQEFANLGEALKPIAAAIGVLWAVLEKFVWELLAGAISHAGEIFGGLLTVVTNIVGGVADLISGLVATITNLVQGDWAGAWDAATAMSSSFETHIQGIKDGVVEAFDGLTGAIWDAVTNLVNDLTGKNLPKWDEFKDLVVLTFLKLKAGVNEKIDALKSDLEALPKKIVGFFKDLPAEFLKLGENLITSLADAIASRADSYLREKAQGIATMLPQWVKDLLGIASPSTVFRDIGYSVMAGFGLGMEDGLRPVLERVSNYMRLIVEQFNRLAKELSPEAVNSAAAVTDPIARTFANLVTVIDAIANLAAFRDPGDLTAKVTAVAAAIKAIVTQLVDLAGWAAAPGNTPETNLAYSAKAVTDPVAIVADNLARILETLAGLAAYNAAVTVGQVRDIISQIKLVVTEFDALAGEPGFVDLVAGALGLSTVLAEFAAALQSIPSLLTALSGIRDFGGEAVTAGLDGLADALLRIAAKLSWLATQPEITGLTPQALSLAADLASIGESLQKALGFLAELRLWRDAADLDELFLAFRRHWQAIIEQLGGLRRDVGDYMDGALRGFVHDLATLAKGLTDALALLVTLAVWRAASDLETQAKRFAASLKALLTQLQQAGLDLSTGAGNISSTFGAAISALTKGLSDALTLLNNLAGFVAPAQSRIDTFLVAIKILLDAIKTWVTTTLTPAVIADIQTFGAAISALFNGLKIALEVLAGLHAFVAPAKNRIDGFLTAVGQLIADAHVYVTSKLLPSEVAALKDFGTAMSALFGGYKIALEVFAGLTAFVAPTWQHIEAFLVAIDQLLLWAKSQVIQVLTPIEVATIKDFGAMMSALFVGFKTALEVLTGLRDLVAPSWQRIEAFTVALGQMLQWAKLQITTVLTPAEVTAVKDFGAMTSALFVGFKTALEVFIGLTGAQLPMLDRMMRFLMLVQEVIGNAQNWVQNFITPAETAAVAALGGALNALFGGFKAALDVFVGLATLPAGFDSRLDAFLAAVWKVVTDAKNYITTVLTPAEVTAVQALGSALMALFSGYKTALDTLSGLAALTMPANSKISAFLNTISMFIIRAYTLTRTVLDPAEIVAVQAFGNALSALFGGYKTALDVLNGLASLTVPAAIKLNTFLNAVNAFIGQAYTLTVMVLGPAKLAAIQAFGAMLGALFGGYKTALDTLSGLASLTVPASTKINVFLNAVNAFISQAYTLTVMVLGPAKLAAIQAFGTMLGALFGGYKTALDTLSGLAAFVAPADSKLSAFLNAVGDFIGRAYTWTRTVLGPAEATAVQAFGSALSALFGGYKAALDMMGGLAEFVTPADTYLDAFLAAVLKVINDTKVYITTNLTPAVTADLTVFANTINALFTGLKAALDLFTELASFTGLFGNRMTNFLVAVTATMTAIATYVANSTQPVADAATVAFGNAVNAVFGGLTAAVDFFKGLQGYIPVLNTRIQAFLNSVTYAYGLVQSYATGAGVQAGTTATTAFANATSAVFGALSSALGLFKQLVEGTDTPTEVFKQRMALLVERINGTLSAFKTYVTDALGTAWLPAANSFTTAVNAVLDVLKKALDLFVALDEHGLPSMAQLQDLIDYILRLFATLTSGVSAFIPIVDTTIGDIAVKIGGLPKKLPTDATIYNWGANVGYQFIGGLNWIANYTGATGMPAVIARAGQTLAGYLNSAFGPNSALPVNMTAFGQKTGNNIAAGIAKGIDPVTSGQATVLKAAMRALVDFMTTTITGKLGIASPSRVMAALFAQVPAGAAVGILAGIPDVRAATRRLAAAVEPGLTGLFGRSEFAVSNERRIVVEFRGQAGGGVPLSAQQFDALKSELAFAIRLGA